MKNFAQMIVLVAAVMALPACEMLKTEKKAPTEPPIRLTERPGALPQPEVTTPTNIKPSNMVFSGGSVEVFSLDDAAPSSMGMSYPETSYSAGVPSVYADPQGMPLSSDPRVTVYPIDGDQSTYVAMGAGNYGAGMSSDMSSMPRAPDEKVQTGELSPRVAGSVSSVYFPYGSANLNGSDKAALKSVAETAKFAPVDRVSVEGFASTPTQTNDPVESRILNLRESLKRAGKVSEHLIEEGVPAEKIKTVGWGDTKQGAGGEAEQRRVDILTAPGASY